MAARRHDITGVDRAHIALEYWTARGKRDRTPIAVGPSVTQRPPHRSRRAVFPHRALQTYSLPHEGLDRRSCPSHLWPSYDSWLFYLEVVKHLFVSCPVIAAPMTTPVKPLEQDAYHAVIELLQAGKIAVYSIVVVISSEFGV